MDYLIESLQQPCEIGSIIISTHSKKKKKMKTQKIKHIQSHKVAVSDSSAL